MTRAQKKWLKVLREEGFVAYGAWNTGQRNRPLRALVQMSYASIGMGPRDSCLQTFGFIYVEKKKTKSNYNGGLG